MKGAEGGLGLQLNDGKLAWLCSGIFSFLLKNTNRFLPQIISFSAGAVNQIKQNRKSIAIGLLRAKQLPSKFTGPRDPGQRSHRPKPGQESFI